MMREDIKPCPNCGFFPALHKTKNKFYYECAGDCWTQTSKYYSPERALKAWNELSEKKVTHDELKPCPSCGGLGWIIVPERSLDRVDCPDCEGIGEVIGNIHDSELLEVTPDE